MYERILVPTDGSDCADEAVSHALHLAGRYDATVHVLFVADTRRAGVSAPAISAADVRKALVDRGEDVTADVKRRATEAGVEAVTAVEEGTPSKVIRRYVESEGVDLVVMGTHGRTGLERHLVGSVAERTVRRSPVPVLTVRRDDE